MTILFAYDGSHNADDAIAAAGHLLAGQYGDAVVVSVWEPAIVEGLRAVKFGAPAAISYDAAEEDRQAEHQARQLAEHGARIAGRAGFETRAQPVADTGNVAGAIVAAAGKFDADVIVLGARGLTGIAAFLGSVSIHVLEHAHRPVLIVPPKPLPAAARRKIPAMGDQGTRR